MTGARVAVGAAGGGARGAYEAGALSVLVPWLCERGERPTVFVGTSAGSINATVFAAVAHEDPVTGAGKVLDAWRSLRLRDVISSTARRSTASASAASTPCATRTCGCCAA